MNHVPNIQKDKLLLCRDCQFCKPDFALGILTLFLGRDRWRFAQCRRPSLSSGANPVTGDERFDVNYCSVERGNYKHIDVCGPSAKYCDQRRTGTIHGPRRVARQAEG